jgi:hypothetical protein
MKTNIRALALASGLIAATTFAACGILVAFAPGKASSVLGWVLHIDLTSLARPLTLGNFVGGLLLFSLFIGSCVAATAWLYRKLAGPERYTPA